MDKTALITGATGQDGSYLSDLLLEKEYKVYGMIRRSSTDTTERIQHLLNHPSFELIEGDITDATGIHRLVNKIKPTEIYNLAAMSHVGISFDQPILTFEIDAVGPLNILEAIRQSSPSSKFYQASTSELYGDTSVTPQNEETSFNPCSPYAIAKLAAHHLVTLYRNAYNVFACAGILFNHESEKRGENFVTRKITKYVASLMDFKDQNKIVPMKHTDVKPLFLGNIDTKRDWSHAKDMVMGMWLMMQQNYPDDYVLASGQSRTIRQFLEAAFAVADLNYMDYIEIDPKFYRPTEIHLLEGDSSKARRELNWQPSISFDDLVKQMVLGDCRKDNKCRD